MANQEAMKGEERCPTCGDDGPDVVLDDGEGGLDLKCGNDWHDRFSGNEDLLPASSSSSLIEDIVARFEAHITELGMTNDEAVAVAEELTERVGQKATFHRDVAQ